MRVLFVIPKNKFAFFGYRGISPTFPHLGVAYLIAVLQREGIDVRLFDEGEGGTDQQLFQMLEDFKPDLVGITIFTLSRPFAYALVKKIKEKINVPIVLGGAHVSTVKKEVLKETTADFAVKYEGEYALLDLVRALAGPKTDFSKIRNLIWRSSKEIIENPDAPFISDLDQLPFPYFDFYHIRPHPSYGRKIIPIITSRGCPYSCDFCSVRLSMGRGFRKRSAQNVFEEIKYHYNKGYCQFDINDDCFTVDRKRAEDILDLIINSRMKINFQFYNGLRVDTVDPRLLGKLKTAGCLYISYGCESGNEEILKKIKKGITLPQVRNAVKWTNEAGIANSVNFIIGHRDETFQTAMDSVNFARSLPASFVGFFNLVPYPSTEAFAWVSRHGKFLVDTNNYLEAISYVDNKPIFETTEFTREERLKITELGFSIHEYSILRHRFGKMMGFLLFKLTRCRPVKIFAARFATMNKWGNKIAVLLSKKSYKHYCVVNENSTDSK